jgi:hypothetical protein
MTRMRYPLLLGLLGILLAVGACSDRHADGPPAAGAQDAAHDHDPAGVAPAGASGAPAPAAPANPVQAEMRALHDATRDWVTAIADNDLARIPPGMSSVHAARQVTEQALLSGRYRPPKASDDVAGFTRQDDAFHDELVTLLDAARASDLPRATRQLGVVLEGCTVCHQKYRF